MKIEYSIFFLKFTKCTESNACVIYKLGTFLVTCPIFIFYKRNTLNTKLCFLEIYEEVTETPCDRLSTFFNWIVLKLSTKQLYQRINHCILVINVFTCMLYFWNLCTEGLLVSCRFPSYRHLRIVSAKICWGKRKFVSSFLQRVQLR